MKVNILGGVQVALRLQVKEIAQQQGLNQTDLIKRSGVSAQLMNRYWNNHMDGVRFDPLERIANALGVPATSLIVSDSDPAPESASKDDIAASEQK